MLKLPPLSLYIHYPWCVKKCPYCDFNSHQAEDDQGYVEALLSDLEQDRRHIQGRAIESIFIGGGTPSLLSVPSLEKLLLGLEDKLDFAPNMEVTLEANPGTFEQAKFREFKTLGVNRLSLGVQSFNDQHLKALGRIHSASEALTASEMALSLFDNVNLDLMYGLPEQSLTQCLTDVHQALELSPQHVSFYQLTLEPNTYFAKYPPALPETDKVWQMGEQGANLLKASGLSRYEVSAYGQAAKHNLNYWHFGDYLGLGAGAHGKITDIKSNQIIRTLKPKSPSQYLSNNTAKVHEIENLAFDFMLNALRLKAGFDISLFSQRTGLALSSIEAQLTKAQDLGLIEQNQDWIRPSAQGYNFLNDLQELFL